MTLLAELWPFDGGKPEGLAVVREAPAGYELLTVRDGAKKGGLTRWALTRA